MRRPFNDAIERGTPAREFTEGDAQAGIQPTKVSEELLNILWDEFSNAIEWTGDTLDDTGVDREQFRRAIQWISGEGYRVGAHWIVSPDLIGPSPGWPWFRLTQPSGIVPIAEWPLLVPYLRERKLTALGTDSFSVSVEANGSEATYSLPDSPDVAELMRQLDQYLAQHGSYASWFALNQPTDAGGIVADDYAITEIDSVARTIKTAASVTVGATPTTVSIYPHRIPGRTDRARHYQLAGVVQADVQNQGVTSALHTYMFGLQYAEAPPLPTTATPIVANAGFRQSRVQIFDANATSIRLYARAGQAPTEILFDEQVNLSGPGPHSWVHTGLIESETYFYMAVAETATGAAPPSPSVQWIEADEILATYSVPGSYDYIPVSGITQVQAVTVGGGGQGGAGGWQVQILGPGLTIYPGGPGGGGGSGEMNMASHAVTPGVAVPLIVGAGGSALGQAPANAGEGATGGEKGAASSFAGQVSVGGAGGGGGRSTSDTGFVFSTPGEDSPPYTGGAAGTVVFPAQGGGGGGGGTPGTAGPDGTVNLGPSLPGGAGGASLFGGYGAGGDGGAGGAWNDTTNPTAGVAGVDGLVQVIG